MSRPDRSVYLDKLKDVKVRNVQVGHQGVELVGPDGLDDAQVGFAVDIDGNDLTGTPPEFWGADWLVIALEESMGDPLFVDTADAALPVYIATHGRGDWSERDLVADTFDGFADALAWVDETAGGATTPVELEDKPLPEPELDELLERIQQRNPNADDLFWRSFFRFGED